MTGAWCPRSLARSVSVGVARGHRLRLVSWLRLFFSINKPARRSRRGRRGVVSSNSGQCCIVVVLVEVCVFSRRGFGATCVDGIEQSVQGIVLTVLVRTRALALALRLVCSSWRGWVIRKGGHGATGLWRRCNHLGHNNLDLPVINLQSRSLPGIAGVVPERQALVAADPASARQCYLLSAQRAHSTVRPAHNIACATRRSLLLPYSIFGDVARSIHGDCHKSFECVGSSSRNLLKFKAIMLQTGILHPLFFKKSSQVGENTLR